MATSVVTSKQQTGWSRGMRDGRLRRWELTDCLFRHGSKQSKQDKHRGAIFPLSTTISPASAPGEKKQLSY